MYFDMLPLQKKNRKLSDSVLWVHNGCGQIYLINSFFPQIVSLTMTVIGFLLKFMSDNEFIKGAEILLHNGCGPTYLIQSFSADCLPHRDHNRIPPEVHVRQPIHQRRMNFITQRLGTDLFYSFFFPQIVVLTMTIIWFLLKFMSDNELIKIENFDYTTITDRPNQLTLFFHRLSHSLWPSYDSS